MVSFLLISNLSIFHKTFFYTLSFFQGFKYHIIEKLPRIFCREYQGLSTEYKKHDTTLRKVVKLPINHFLTENINLDMTGPGYNEKESINELNKSLKNITYRL